MDGINEELAMEYAFVRRQWPADTSERIAERIAARLSAEHQLLLAEDALLWHQEPATRRDLALMAVRNFVLAIEADPDDEPGPAASGDS